MLAFPGRRGREMVQTIETYDSVAKYYGLGRCSTFLVRKGPLGHRVLRGEALYAGA